MKLLISNIIAGLDASPGELRQQAAKRLQIKLENISDFKIVKQSIDARKKPGIRLVYSVSCQVDHSVRISGTKDVKILEEVEEEAILPGSKPVDGRPLIIGTGPAGLFCGLVLAQYGYRPIVLERGRQVEERSKAVEDYWKTGKLDTETNVQFGEGGAGTFSDGKLTTRINDRRCEKVLEEFCSFGAPEEMSYKAKPHIGTDNLKKVVANMRKEIERLGGTVLFNTKAAEVTIRNGRICGVVTCSGEAIETNVVVLAIGHSARDTFQMLYDRGVPFQQKPFSIGVRIEHPQELINYAQYGEASGHPALGAADYQLFLKGTQRTAYSFCMCPGGIVVASASEPQSIVTNGMSEFSRSRENANSALVVSVGPADFGTLHPLGGIEFQRKWERLAFAAGGSNNSAPVQRLEDFMDSRTGGLGSVRPSYTGETRCADINLCLPPYVTDCMKQAIPYFDRKLKGFGLKDALLTGVETRTSSPVRIPRNEQLECIGIEGLYPCGEGAGYAGGIVSAAVDGIKVAEQIVRTYRL
ncbi:D-amino acid dehydrogenase small subunit [Ruminiclostridium hungatei]|uniref:D-amino acid dehydrogenase small subunit n=1 Tax=Ruminiclostridium hungatei TaxID=48256 RepID=A0A1V4SH23_RUMHU|nr:FAD-dependent monooxygenase [Ruminiclostridium hungatei]OPX42765.1 D-amino acid dehydrogenase small subunit [Ruminiclostridium hungatei]